MSIQKIEAQSPEAQSADLLADNIAKLRALFPELVTETLKGGKPETVINVDVLKALVGDANATDAGEKYGLNWHGKRRARQLALTPSTGTLRPCPDESVDWDSTQNLMIEGDNLEVLKLLQKSYAGKVKLIYIDPPYNTGKDFVYPDNFQDNIKNYLELTGQVEGGAKISSNTEASGRFHTDWLNMMYPRLKLARNLLKNDGVIFISIDDTEVANLRQMCDQIFGEENFLVNAIWQKKYGVSSDAKGIPGMHDHVLVYQKSGEFIPGLLPRTDKQDAVYKNLDNDLRGLWRSSDLTRTEYRERDYYAIVSPKTGEEFYPPKGSSWRHPKDEMERMIADNRVWFGVDGTSRPAAKRFLAEVKQGVVASGWWPFSEVGHTDESKKEVQSLFDGVSPFDTPKPTRLIDRMLEIGALGKDELVLDFFAGSGSTGHSVIARNAKTAGSARFMLVQLPEPLSPDVKEQKLAADLCDQLKRPRHIAELTKERLRRAGAKVKADNPMFSGDTGFRVFKLDTSNIRAWQPSGNLPQDLVDNMSHLNEGRSNDDVLYELLLKLGLDLCVPMAERSIAGKTVHSIGGGTLMACLDDSISAQGAEALALGMAAWRAEQETAGDTTAVFRDSAFENDVAKSNLAAILAQHGVAQVRSL
jgi:adenine-specific DNA-methyltransferase